MSKLNEEVEALFQAAVALETEAQRADYLNRACSDPELRREVESLLAAHDHPACRRTPRAWLLAIARTTALDWFRADARRRRREERADAAELRRRGEGAFGEGLSPALEDGLRALTAGEREVVALRVVLDLDGEETARLLGITPTAVSTRLSRALAKLEERMRDHGVVD